MVAELMLGILELFSKNFMYGYLSGLNSFPKPLTKEEEAVYLEKFKGGDEEARNILIERNLRLVAHIVKKYTQSSRDSDDLISIGTIGLIKAISNFDNTKGVRLATYAIRCIENATLSQMSFWLRKELPIGELPNRLRKICISCRTPKTVKQNILLCLF